MLQIQRLNLDSSWAIDWDNTKFIIDPWLIGSEIDGFAWLNQQWHNTEPVSISQLPDYQFILISQSYEDHCHIETLDKLNDSIPLLATPKPFKKINRKLKNRKKLNLIPAFSEKLGLKYQNLRFYYFHPGVYLDPIYYAILMVNEQNEAIFYSPHGFLLNSAQKEFLAQFKFQLLISTFSEFQIPAIMGGKVNPGLENVAELIKILQPKYALNTHDEQKIMKGLVSRLAKVKYPDFEQITAQFAPIFISSEHYQPIQLI